MPAVPSNVDSRPLAQRLAAYGCTDFIRLDERLSRPEQLDYLDLLPKQSKDAPILTAVAEHQGAALLYFVDAGEEVRPAPTALAAVRRQLANRSDPAWVGVVEPSSLEVFPIGFKEAAEAMPVKVIQEGSPTAPLFFQNLVHGTFEGNRRLNGMDFVFESIFELLTQTTDEFVPKEGKGRLDALEVLSMAGRALFFRFLIDRHIVLQDELRGRDGICPAAVDLKDVFSTVEKAARTSAWLDCTFNGDFLPLINEAIPATDRAAREVEYSRFYQRVNGLVGRRFFAHLEAILRGWRGAGGSFQPELDWGDLDFAHIPVGVLSQVYESFSHRADPRTARDTSVHYTPRFIAGLMVEEAFAASEDKASAKVLDSSCGAGIFLVLAFRRLVRERWLRDEDRPKTSVIQEILYNHVRGFDISESALRLAALALYITAIELNASPRPPQALKFPRNLRGEVLYRFGSNGLQEKKSTTFVLGSLGPEVPSDFNKTFDIVIGNPPWTRLRDDKDENSGDEPEQGGSVTDALNREFTTIGRRVLTARGLNDLAGSYENPDKNPDVPFLWRAMEWARDGGVIALSMPARLFGRTSGRGFEAWRDVLRSLEVTGLISGADLRWSSVWKDVKMPFCVFFARNVRPGSEHRFYYASPINEPDLNGLGRFRIDYEASHPISVARVEKQPWVLKTLSLGTWLDVELLGTITAAFPETLEQIWAAWNPSGDKTDVGYNRSPNLEQKPAEFLGKFKDFELPEDGSSIQFDALKTYFQRYGKKSAHRPRTETLYRPPLVVVPQSPGDDPQKTRAYISRKPLTFSQSFFGYSCAGHPEAETLAGLIYLLAHSSLFAYFCLMTSRRSGFDRQTFNKEEFDALPFPDLKTLPATTNACIRNLAHRLEQDAIKPWGEMDSFIFHLYGLGDDAVQVARDTLFSAASYRRAGKAALERTRRETRADFVNALREALEPYFDVCGQHAAVHEAEFQFDAWREPWFFLAISREADRAPVNANLMRKAMELANDRGTSRIIVQAPGKHGLLVGLLNQRRWWTVTRARLCSQHIIRRHLGAFGLAESA